MAFKMNKKNVNFGEGTGSSPKKFIGGVGGLVGGSFGIPSVFGERGKAMREDLRNKQYESMVEKHGEEKANLKMRMIHGDAFRPPGSGGEAEKLEAINKVINS
tara:strand:+ start:1021 stop:1329 length:309 start_codon:yes stop_codon:yes gene_type:complete